MRQHTLRRLLIALGVSCVALSLLVMGVMCYVRTSRQKQGADIYHEVRSALQDYPELAPEYNYGGLYCCDEAYEYLVIHIGDSYLTARRGNDEATQYYMDGKVWTADSDGGLTTTGVIKDPVIDHVGSLVSSLMCDPELTYSYERNRGINLPLWVLPGNRYIRCSRPSSENQVEIMAVNGAEEPGNFVQWNIAQLSEGEEKAYLFIILYADKTLTSETAITYLRGWGEIPKAVSAMLLERELLP